MVTCQELLIRCIYSKHPLHVAIGWVAGARKEKVLLLFLGEAWRWQEEQHGESSLCGT